MKPIIVTLIVGVGFLISIPASYANEFKERVSKEFTVAGSALQTTLAVYNIFG